MRAYNLFREWLGQAGDIPQIADNVNAMLPFVKGGIIFIGVALMAMIVLQVILLRKMHRNSGGNTLSSFLLAAALVFGGVANAPVAVADDYSDFGIAVESGDVEQVKHYINAGLDLDKETHGNLNALQVATLFNHPEIVKMLLAAGANLNATGRDEGTALDYAIYGGKHAIVEILQDASDSQYIATLRREHCEWLQDVRCEDDTPEETAAVATEETDYGVLYGSLAWRETPTHYHWYWVLNAADEGEANTDVGNYCDADVGNTTDCKLGGAFNNGCAAIAVGENDGIVIASGDSTFAARREAITFCNESGGVGCKAVDSVCTADVEDKEAAAKAKQEKENGSVAK